MKKEEILSLLKEDEKQNLGEILQITEKGIEYFDYEYSWEDHTLFFRDEKYCTEEELKKLIFVAKESRKYGITEEYIASILTDAYEDCLADMMTTLRAVAVIHSEEDMKDVFKFAGVEYDFIDLENAIGKSIFDCQICIIHEGKILDTVSDINETKEYGDVIYQDGIGVTVIHECRHQMLDCNFLLSEEKYPTSLNSEDNVEDFARERWDEICNNHELESKYLVELEDK